MLKYSLLLLIVTTCLLGACSKSLSNGDAAFDVQVNATDLAVGDTATFSFRGNPDVITFYSGEVGKRYEYRDRISADGIPTLRFRTIRANGAQANSLAVMVSDNFEGVLVKDTPATVSRITSATWTDITARATLSTGGTAAVVSGSIDLSDFSTKGKPVYVAFKYQGFAGSAQSKWTIDSFSVKNVLADGTSYEIANMNAGNISFTNYGVPSFSPGFSAFRVTNSYYWVVNNTTLVITGATSAAAAAPAEAWVVLGPVDLKKVTPDIGVQVKNAAQRAEDLKLIYKYPAVGVYNIVFSGGKVSSEEGQYTTKTFQITVK